MRHYYPKPGERIFVSIDSAVALARGDCVTFIFNDVELIVDENSGQDEIYLKYREKLSENNRKHRGLLEPELFEI